jgi:hypothetical protein
MFDFEKLEVCQKAIVLTDVIYSHDYSTAFFADGFSSMEQLATGFLPNKAVRKTGKAATV